MDSKGEVDGSPFFTTDVKHAAKKWAYGDKIEVADVVWEPAEFVVEVGNVRG
jgi:hypothetical protein